MTISPVLMFLLQSSIAVSIYLVAWHYDAHCFTPRFQQQFLYPAAFVSAMVLMRAVNLLDIPLLNSPLYTTVSLFVLCLALYRCNFQQAFVRVMPYVLVCLFCDPFSILLPAILSHHSIAEVQQSNTLSLLCCSINVLLFLFAYQIFTMLTLRYKAVTLSLQKICFLIGLIVGEVFALEAMMQMMEDSTDTIWLLLAITGFLCVDIYAAFVIYQDSRIQQEKTALELAKKQNKIQLDYYRTLGKNYQDSRILLHDMKKHLAVVEGLLQQENATAAQPYFQELYQNVNNLFQGFHCTNPILSIVMGQKISEAEEADIHISTDIEDLPLEFLEDCDITAIFSNLWDNAIAANCTVPPEQRRIHIQMHQINHFVIIAFANQFNGILNRCGTELHSTKPDHTGIGLTSIRSTVEKYDGIFQVKPRPEAHTFTAQITLPIPEPCPVRA